ncbi:MAG: CapA family protein [Lachnospiraceae bacterium]|nr:CapA family protein [Lachnospiraceae bacterium]
MKGRIRRLAGVFGGALLVVLLIGAAVLAGMGAYKNAGMNRKIPETMEQEEGQKKDAGEIDESRLVNEVVLPKETEKESQDVPELEGKYGEILADPERMKEERIIAKEAAREEEVILAFAGDICFDENYSNMYYLSQRGGDISKCFSEDLYKEMTEADIFMVNNEFTYTTRGEPVLDKAFTFRSNPDNVKLLRDMGVDIVSLANNHAYDYGEVSLLDTLETLEKEGMPYVGAGRNLEEAGRPVYFICNDIKIAIVSATQVERLDNPDTKGAGENSPGVFRCWGNQLDDLLERVKEAKSNSDFVVAYIHWGTENTDELDWAQTYQAPLIAEAGADVIIGGHTHCLQGIDVVNNVPVIYSVGNFWFNSKSLDSCIIKVAVDQQGLKSFQFLPAKTEGCRTYQAEGQERTQLMEYMRELSPNVRIEEDGSVEW